MWQPSAIAAASCSWCLNVLVVGSETPPAAVLLLLQEGVPAAGSMAVWLARVARKGAYLYPACA